MTYAPLVRHRRSPRPFRAIDLHNTWFSFSTADQDPDSGILPGTPFEQIPENWCCLVCSAKESDFVLCSR
ncbi:rubredoxin [bacterium]|nr:rubredoxin [bacterium]